jgi:hypothetical protein
MLARCATITRLPRRRLAASTQSRGCAAAAILGVYRALRLVLLQPTFGPSNVISTSGGTIDLVALDELQLSRECV